MSILANNSNFTLVYFKAACQANSGTEINCDMVKHKLRVANYELLVTS